MNMDFFTCSQRIAPMQHIQIHIQLFLFKVKANLYLYFEMYNTTKIQVICLLLGNASNWLVILTN